MINNIIFISVFLTSLTGCSNEILISDLQNKTISFSNLPLKIQNIFINGLDSEDVNIFPENATNINSISLISLNTSNDYKIESIETIIGPWTSYKKITDISKGFTYRLNSDSPSPLIVFKNKLFVPVEYNILIWLKDNTFMKKQYFQEYKLN